MQLSTSSSDFSLHTLAFRPAIKMSSLLSIREFLSALSILITIWNFLCLKILSEERKISAFPFTASLLDLGLTVGSIVKGSSCNGGILEGVDGGSGDGGVCGGGGEVHSEGTPRGRDPGGGMRLEGKSVFTWGCGQVYRFFSRLKSGTSLGRGWFRGRFLCVWSTKDCNPANNASCP